MSDTGEKYELIQKLQHDILRFQGLTKSALGHPLLTGLDPLEAAFPDGTFPVSAVHEFISYQQEHAAATSQARRRNLPTYSCRK